MVRKNSAEANPSTGTKRRLLFNSSKVPSKKRKIDDEDEDFIPEAQSEEEDTLEGTIPEEDENLVDNIDEGEEEEEDFKDFFAKRSTKGKGARRTPSTSKPKTSEKTSTISSSPRTPHRTLPTKHKATSVELSFNSQKGLDGKGNTSAVNRYDWLEEIRDKNKRLPTDPNYDPSTLYIPPEVFNTLTPFEAQFWKVKQNHYDTVVFFKKGYFYELYENDADIGVKEFDLKMTDRVNMRMVGIPDHCLYQWAGRFLAKGYKITLVDQAETKLAMDRRLQSKGKKSKDEKVIRREVTRILTQGTLIEEEYTADYNSSCLMAVKEIIVGEEYSAYGICVVDCSISKIYFMSFEDDHLHSHFETLLLRLKPREILLEKGEYSNKTKHLIDHRLSSPVINVLSNEQFSADFSLVKKIIEKHTNDERSSQIINTLKDHQMNVAFVSSLAAILHYLEKVKIANLILPHVEFIDQNENKTTEREYLELDAQTLLNLEILENINDHGKEGTLLNLLDHCITPFGKRMLRSWVYKPLFSISKINARLDAVEYLNANPSIASEFQKYMKGIGDMERLTAKMGGVSGVKVKDFLNVLNGFEAIWSFVTEAIDPIPETSSLLHSLLSLNSSGGEFPELEQEINHFKSSFNFEATKETGTIEPIPGMDDVYDAAIGKINDIKLKLEKHKQQLEKSLKIPIRYVHKIKEKYQLEIDKSQLQKAQLPKDFQIVTETKSAKRFYTPYISQLLSQMPLAEEELTLVKEGILHRYLLRFNHSAPKWQKAVNSIAIIDCLLSLSKVSLLTGHMCRPLFLSSPPPSLSSPSLSSSSLPPNQPKGRVKDGGIYVKIENMRHPMIAGSLGAEYIPNSITLGSVDHPERVILLTGPNMGGKSTLLRQVAVLIILSQLGSFVPASSCSLSLFDRIFTRIGASDNIFEGQSTFLVELQETSTILREATNQSLIILDELGRGTSTYDGYAIAYAALLHLANSTKAAILFSTHYHLLTDELCAHPNISLKYMNCYVDHDLLEVIYLYKMKDGVCPKSYGMNVAKVAGIPSSIIENAQIVSKQFEDTQPLQKLQITFRIFRELFAAMANTSKANFIYHLHRLQSKIKNRNTN